MTRLGLPHAAEAGLGAGATKHQMAEVHAKTRSKGNKDLSL